MNDYKSLYVGRGWVKLLQDLIEVGRPVSPRGMGSREIIGVRFEVTNGYNNLFNHPVRNLSYRFAVAEWLWIWFGHNDVKTISQYSSVIANFSDDGETFSGAYGPHVVTQWPRVMEVLRKDPDSRQAVISIFTPQKRKSKDVPCTLTCQFLLREGYLHTLVNMRSSDIWLGLPYDIYNFSMIGNISAASLGVKLGSVIFYLGSSHLYDKNHASALEIVRDPLSTLEFRSPQLPGMPPKSLQHALMTKTDGHASREWLPEPVWDIYGGVLGAKTNAEAEGMLGSFNEQAESR